MRTSRTLALLGVAFASTPALAVNLQFKPFVQVGVQRDDNVFRAPDAPPAGSAPKTADTLKTAGAGLRLTLSESLQELEVRGEYERVDYSTLNSLDYNRYRLDAEARLAYTTKVRLKLDAGRERRQETFAYRDDTTNSFVTTDQAKAELRLAATPSWTVITKAEHYETRASRQASQDYDLSEQSGELGLEYRRNGYSSLGVAFRGTQGEYPRRISTPGDGREKDYEQYSVLARVGYTPSGLSDLTAQMGYTQRGHDDSSVPDFSGITGRVGYIRRFSGVSQVQLEAYRDLYYVEDINANYVENLGLRLSYDYRWSAKLALAMAAERYESGYESSPGFTVAGQARRDEVFNIRFGTRYQPFYRFSILPSYRYERRGSSLASNSYDFSVIGIDFSYEYGPRR